MVDGSNRMSELSITPERSRNLMVSRQPGQQVTRIYYTNADRLRIIALLDIVAFHMDIDADRMVFGIGLPVFLILSLAFSSSHAPEQVSSFLPKRFKRIIVPWLAWSLFYGAFQILIHHHNGIFSWLKWRMLIYGTWDHLWFLPFIFAAGLIVTLLHQLTWRFPMRHVVLVGFLTAMCLLALVDYYPCRFKKPFEQFWFALPSLPLGLCIGRLLAQQAFTRHQWAWCVVLVILAGSGVALKYADPTSVITRYYLAMCAIMAIFIWPGRPEKLTTAINRLLYGIYLIHPFIIYILYFRMGKPQPIWLYAIIIMAISGVVIWLLTRTRLRVFV